MLVEFQKGDEGPLVRNHVQLALNGAFEMFDAAGRGYGPACFAEDIVTEMITRGGLQFLRVDRVQRFPGHHIHRPN